MEDRLLEPDAGRVDEDVEAAEAPERLSDQAVAVGDDGDVAEHDRVRKLVPVLARAGGRLRGDVLRLRRVPAADGHAHTLLREPIDDGLTEARGASRDEGHFAVKSAHDASYWAA